MKRILAVVLVGALIFASGCTLTSTADQFNGLTDMQGEKVMHQNTTNIALHLLFREPLVHDASLQATVDDFTSEAKANGASHVRIVQSSKCTYWWILPPISFIVHPVVANVAGDAK
jgi:hypothetical protein